MSEKDADHYQEYKDSTDEWGDAVPAPFTPSRRLAAMVSVRFTPDEEALLRAKASEVGDSLSHFIRHAAMAAASPASRPSATSTGSIGSPLFVRVGGQLVPSRSVIAIAEPLESRRPSSQRSGIDGDSCYPARRDIE